MVWPVCHQISRLGQNGEFESETSRRVRLLQAIEPRFVESGYSILSEHHTFTFSKPWLSAAERLALAKRLRESREALRMTKREFARQVQVTENTTWSWENGRTQPNP